MKEQHIFSDNIEQGALDQFDSAMEQDFTVKGALMPDAHQGYSLPIGGVVATDGMILPSWVGYDIGCGMCAIKTDFDKVAVAADSQNIFEEIYKRIPVGFNRNKKPSHNPHSFDHCSEDLKRIYVEREGDKQLCSLGGGNHFIEIGYDENDAVWIIIHSGSRGFGWLAAKHYMTAAANTGKATEGHFGFRTDSDQGQAYITDMNYCLDYALENRKQMIMRVLACISAITKQPFNCGLAGLINRNHNHATERDGLWIHRKGATHAESGMMGVIPGNMRDGSFIVCGKGNPDALWSSSHGAGRVLGRKAAKAALKVEDFVDTMQGITASVGEKTLDEAPMAYKDIFEVMRLQSGLVDVLHHIKPLINIKG